MKGGRCRLIFGPEIKVVTSGNHAEDVKNITQTCSDFIESYIRETPQFWIWGHKRWKRGRKSP
jgi:KDO2-lipid IV(A) lauroyltransferase